MHDHPANNASGILTLDDGHAIFGYNDIDQHMRPFEYRFGS